MLHGQLAEEGFSQVYVDQMDPNIVAVTRHSPITHQSVILVAHTAFGYPNMYAGPTAVRPLQFEGSLDEIILEADITLQGDKPFDRPAPLKKNDKYINGYTQFNVNVREHIPLTKSQIFGQQAEMEGNLTKLNFVNLKPGSVVAIRFVFIVSFMLFYNLQIYFRVSLPAAARSSAADLQSLTKSLSHETGDIYEQLTTVVSKLDLIDLNRVLFTCDQEERDQGFGGSAYDIPNYGPVVYCGLQGFISLLTEISPNNDLGHPLCNNLRQGNWMMGKLFFYYYLNC